MKPTDKAPKRGLVLTRTLGQSILVEHGLLEIQVVGLGGGKVRLKFIGQVAIDRAEKFEDKDLV
jgi:sRNA-binding carbon storage regulator CsrA